MGGGCETNIMQPLLAQYDRSILHTNLPTLQKKLRVMADWTLDIFFKCDVIMLKTILEEDGRDADFK